MRFKRIGLILFLFLLYTFSFIGEVYGNYSYSDYNNYRGIYTTSSTSFKTTSGYLNTNRYGYYGNQTYTSPNVINNRIGYTTVGYGNRTNVGMVRYGGSTNNTYNPGQANSRPRRITVYNGDGETGQTPGGNSDSSDWLYMQDSDGNWYCSKDGGITWFKWENKEYNSLIAYLIDYFIGNTEAWSTTPTTPPENSSHWASDPDDPFLTPIDDKYILLFFAIMAFVYCFEKKAKKNSK